MSRQQKSHLLEFDWIIPLSFWILLFISATIFGALVLSPKLEVYWGLQAEQKQNTERLESLAEEIEYLQRVVQALEHDPEFQAELAQIDLHPQGLVEERTTLNLQLSIPSGSLAPMNSADDSSALDETPDESWLVRQNRELVQDHILRNKLYLILAGLVLFSFIFLQDNSTAE